MGRGSWGHSCINHFGPDSHTEMSNSKKKCQFGDKQEVLEPRRGCELAAGEWKDLDQRDKEKCGLRARSRVELGAGVGWKVWSCLSGVGMS